MATIVNDRDILLQAAPARLLSVTLPSNVTVLDAVTALAELGNITSDDVLSKGEKTWVILHYTAIVNEQAGIDTSADTFSISRTAYDTAVTALGTYLSSLVPDYSDVTQDTPIVGSTFRSKFDDVFNARQALLNAIDARIVSTDYLALNAATEIVSMTASNVSVTHFSNVETTVLSIAYTPSVTGNVILTLSGKVSFADLSPPGGVVVWGGSGIRIKQSVTNAFSQQIAVPKNNGNNSDGSFSMSTGFTVNAGTAYTFSALIYWYTNTSDCTVNSAEMRLEAIKR